MINYGKSRVESTPSSPWSGCVMLSLARRTGCNQIHATCVWYECKSGLSGLQRWSWAVPAPCCLDGTSPVSLLLHLICLFPTRTSFCLISSFPSGLCLMAAIPKRLLCPPRTEQPTPGAPPPQPILLVFPAPLAHWCVDGLSSLEALKCLCGSLCVPSIELPGTKEVVE